MAPAQNLRTKDDVVRYLRDVALVLDLKELHLSPATRRA
jgi:hypothetical protein